MRILSILALLLSAWWAGCTRQGFEPAEPCEGVDCSGHGECGETTDGLPACLCEQGYHAEELACVENDDTDPCEGVTCSDRGSCAVDGSDPVCLCDPGYEPLGATNCVPRADPCEGIDCSGHGICAVTPDGQVICACDAGYRNDTPTSCVPDP